MTPVLPSGITYLAYSWNKNYSVCSLEKVIFLAEVSMPCYLEQIKCGTNFLTGRYEPKKHLLIVDIYITKKYTTCETLFDISDAIHSIQYNFNIQNDVICYRYNPFSDIK